MCTSTKTLISPEDSCYHFISRKTIGDDGLFYTLSKFLPFLLICSISWYGFAQSKVQPGSLLDDLPNTREASFSPGGKEAFVTLEDYNRSRSLIAVVTKKGKKWKYPVVAPFSGTYKDQEPFISPNGLQLFFVSNRPLHDSLPPKNDFDIWHVSRASVDSPWGEPVNVGLLVNTNEDEYYPSVSSSGNLYFTSSREGGYGNEDIWMSRYENGRYLAPEPLSSAINTAYYEFNAYISPNEDLILYSSYGRPDDIGGGDLYYSRRDANGHWEEAVHLQGVNTPGIDYCAFAEQDKKNYYFTSDRCTANASPTRYRDIFEVLKKMEQGRKSEDAEESLPIRDTYILK
jgi:hypothetical protein